MFGLRRQGGKRIEIFVNCAYGDESRDESGLRVYAVAAVFGHESEWREIEVAWQQRLEGRIFHAADCEAEPGRGDFSNLSRSERRKLYRDLVGLIRGSWLIAHAGAIDVRAYKEVFPREFEHAPYLWLFGEMVHEMARLAYFSIPRERVQVTFDRNDIEYNAGLLYDFIRRSKDQEMVALLSDTVAFSTKETVGIQIADLCVREAMKRLDGQLTNKSCSARASFWELSKSPCKLFFHPFGKSYFEEKKKLIHNSAFRDKVSLVQYDQWVQANGLHDCLSNRLRFIQENSKNIGLHAKT